MDDQSKFLANADKFLRDLGCITNFQKNTLIVSTLSVDTSITNVELIFDQNKKEATVILYVRLFSLFIFKKKKITEKLFDFYSRYLPDYNKFKIQFKYGK